MVELQDLIEFTYEAGKEAIGGVSGKLVCLSQTGKVWASCPGGQERRGRVGGGEGLGTRLVARLQGPAAGREGPASALTRRKEVGMSSGTVS